jgi:CheY-like chemotaxis protein
MQEKGGCLTIALAPVALTPEEVKTFADMSPGAYVQLDVTDTGTGIDPQIIGRIFDPFFTTKEVGKGTGMGLAVVHGIVKSYQGAISVQSEPGTGTSFRVLLPRISEAAREEREDAGSLPGGSERILFVDDEELLVQISREMLETLGYSVVALQNSVQALDLFEHDPQGFDLVITDQAMPQINGYELAQKIIGLRPDIPIMLCTGYSETVSEEQALAAGIRGFIMKPIKLQDFARHIRAVLDRGTIPPNAGSAHTH